MGVLERAGLLVLQGLQVPQAGPQVRGVVVGAGPVSPALDEPAALGTPGGNVSTQRLAQGVPVGKKFCGVGGLASPGHGAGKIR